MKDNCEICQLDLFVQDRLKKKYLEGDDPEDLAMMFGLEIDITKAHCQVCIKRPKSTQARYKEIIDRLEDDIEVVRASMSTKGDDGENDNTVPALVQGYARLISEYKDSIVRLDEMTKPEDRVRDTIIQVINPFLREMLHSVTEEVSRLKGEMRVGGIPDDIAAKLLEEFYKRTADKLKRASTMAVDNLNTYFGADSSKRSSDDEKNLQ
jgi:hypothetical protein